MADKNNEISLSQSLSLCWLFPVQTIFVVASFPFLLAWMMTVWALISLDYVDWLENFILSSSCCWLVRQAGTYKNCAVVLGPGHLPYINFNYWKSQWLTKCDQICFATSVQHNDSRFLKYFTLKSDTSYGKLLFRWEHLFSDFIESVCRISALGNGDWGWWRPSLPVGNQHFYSSLL